MAENFVFLCLASVFFFFLFCETMTLQGCSFVDTFFSFSRSLPLVRAFCVIFILFFCLLLLTLPHNHNSRSRLNSRVSLPLNTEWVSEMAWGNFSFFLRVFLNVFVGIRTHSSGFFSSCLEIYFLFLFFHDWRSQIILCESFFTQKFLLFCWLLVWFFFEGF